MAMNVSRNWKNLMQHQSTTDRLFQRFSSGKMATAFSITLAGVETCTSFRGYRNQWAGRDLIRLSVAMFISNSDFHKMKV
jgi:hypothetical protein